MGVPNDAATRTENRLLHTGAKGRARLSFIPTSAARGRCTSRARALRLSLALSHPYITGSVAAPTLAPPPAGITHGARKNLGAPRAGAAATMMQPAAFAAPVAARNTARSAVRPRLKSTALTGKRSHFDERARGNPINVPKSGARSPSGTACKGPGGRNEHQHIRSDYRCCADEKPVDHPQRRPEHLKRTQGSGAGAEVRRHKHGGGHPSENLSHGRASKSVDGQQRRCRRF